MSGADAGVRIDKWLWAARFFKTRSLATEAVEGGKVELNGASTKPAKTVRIGDEVRVRLGAFEHRVIVRAIAERRGSAAAAALLFEETPDSVAARERLREQHRLAPSLFVFEEKGRPTKKDRRRIDRFRER
jgi:ribosome-associated heat shock protein Hsp15